VTASSRSAGGLTQVFAAERPRLVGLAYRITGSRLDAEDVVQDAWVRARRATWSEVERPEAWLTTVVSRLALDHLRAARHRRETYVGPWLPEPVVTSAGEPDAGSPWSVASLVDGGDPAAEDPADQAAMAESVTFGFLRLLETLTPIERVVFLLADVFDTPYREIAVVVDRSPEACRQVASRARRRVRAGRARHDPGDMAVQVARHLLVAVAAGDVDRVLSLLAEDVVMVSDGGAAAHAARRPVVGRERVARLLVNISRREGADLEVEAVTLNGEPGIVARRGGEPYMALAAQIADGLAQAIHAVLNPGKLAALEVTSSVR
jgi:RNA polymerase sigma-70 factor (ECF subfamily)